MANQYVNKVIVNNEIKMDLTEDTITPKTLRKGFTAHDASGAPIVGTETLTDISEDGTDAGPIAELTANGWANQTQLTGKNLLPNNLESQTINDIVFTKNADGSITANGTASATMSPVLSTFSLNAGTYTLSGCPSDGGVDAYRLDFYYNNASQSIADTGNGITATFNKDVTGYARIRIAKDTVVSNLTFYPQLELGSQATEYEPYCGGIPSPNPNYPQEIRVARGRNLLQNTATSQTINGVTFTVNEDGTVTCNGTASVGTSFNIATGLSFENGTYTLSCGNTAPSGVNFAIQTSGGNKLCGTNGSITFSETISGKVWIYLSSGTTVNNLTFYPQLEKGSIATPYVPYGFIGVEAQGKNLFGSLINKTLSGNSTSGYGLNNTGGTSFVGAVKPNTTYTVCDHSTTVGTRFRIVGFVNDPTLPAGRNAFEVISNASISPRQYTFNSGNANYVVLTIDHETYYPEAKAQLELGSEATEYEPYYHKTIPVPLPERGWVGGLPDGTSDILKLNTAGKYEWVENTDEIMLASSESWAKSSTNVADIFYFNGTKYNILSTPYNYDIISTHFIGNNISHQNNVVCDKAFINVSFASGTFDDVSNFKTWLDSNQVTVLYPLATPQTEQGYVPNWDNTLPEHCTIDIPELRDISVRYYLDTASVEPAQRYYERANAELNQVIDDASNDATLEALAAIAPIEGDISSANYLVGAYLIHDNQLCEVTTPIATGEAIAVGTNVVISSVATELGEIQTAVQDIIDDPYILPTMSASEKGGAKVGQGLRIDDDILSVDMSSDDATDAGPLISLQAEGWAEQLTTTGKNLIDAVLTNGIYLESSGSLESGITYTSTQKIDISPSTDYAISFKRSQTNSYVFLFEWQSDNTYIGRRVLNTGTSTDYSTTFTTSANAATIAFSIGRANAPEQADTVSDIQLELGSTATSYEPYTGGVPSPNPDYPQDIRVARGRNLVSGAYQKTTTQVGFRCDDNDELVSGAYYIPLKAGTYTFSMISNRTIGYLYYQYKGESYGSFTMSESISTFELPKDGSVALWVYRSNGIDISEISSAQLELGYVAHPYVPRGCVGMDVKGRNLLPNTIMSQIINGITFAPQSDGSIRVSGTASANANAEICSLSVSTGTYTLSGCPSGGSSSKYRAYLVGLSNSKYDEGNGITFTVDNAAKVTYRIIVYSGQTVNLTFKPQLELGSVAHDYDPYYNPYSIPIPLPSKGFAAALPDGTSDILRLDGAGKWEWESNTQEITFDGSNDETWALSSGSKRVYYNTLIGIIPYTAGTLGTQMCDRFPTVTSAATYNGTLGVGVQDAKLNFSDGTGSMTVADWKTWLTSHPVTVLYPLANPTTEQGYLDNWDNDIPLHATIDIPELRNIGVECYMDEQASTLNAQWSERLRSEMDSTSTNAVTESLASLAPVENDISSANYSTGSYLIHDNQLYKVTTAIATGETISTNTNITSATIANELLDIDSDLLDFSELLEAAKAEYREKFQAIDSWQAAASQLIREDNGYYSNESITRMLAQRFDGKLYGYSEPKTTAVAITKTGANASLANPTLGTATVAGSSAYRHLGPFQWFAAKGIVDSDGVPHVSTIKGIDSDADWNADTNNVWSLRPIQWYSIDSTGGTVIGSLSDTWHLGLKPNPQAYLPDGTLRPYMLAPRYALGFENGVGVSKSGLKGYGRDVSHNSLITKLDYANTGYSGKTIYENWYDIFMSRMIYGTKDFQTIMQGCTVYNYQYHPSVAEQNTTRVILSNANAANLVVGSTMMMGNQATESTDRNNVNAYNIFDGLIIESITEYDADNKSIEFATDTTFNTDPAYLLSTAPWHSGSCDAMDWDGSPTNPQSAKECVFFQGCELMTGVYEVLANIILKSEADARQIPYIVYSSRDDATSVTANFVKCGDGLLSNDGTATASKYPLYIADHNGLLYGEEVGGSTTAGCADAQYVKADSVASDSEWPSVGGLGSGRAAGLSYVYAGNGLGSTHWVIWSRLSPVGLSRG